MKELSGRQFERMGIMNKFIVAMALGAALEVTALAVLTAPHSASAGGKKDNGTKDIDQKSGVSSNHDVAAKAEDVGRDARLGFGPCGVVGEGYICSP